MTQQQSKIVECWDRIDNSDLDISTERMLEMVSQECDCDNTQVCEALAEAGIIKEL